MNWKLLLSVLYKIIIIIIIIIIITEGVTTWEYPVLTVYFGSQAGASHSDGMQSFGQS